jgi:hypothetical protein
VVVKYFTRLNAGLICRYPTINHVSLLQYGFALVLLKLSLLLFSSTQRLALANIIGLIASYYTNVDSKGKLYSHYPSPAKMATWLSAAFYPQPSPLPVMALSRLHELEVTINIDLNNVSKFSQLHFVSQFQLSSFN